jgi:hypothetical protein
MAVLLGDYGERVREVQPGRGMRLTHRELRRLTGGTRLQIRRDGPRAEAEVIGWKLDPATNENVAVDVVLCREADSPQVVVRPRFWRPMCATTNAIHRRLQRFTILPKYARSLAVGGCARLW